MWTPPRASNPLASLHRGPTKKPYDRGTGETNLMSIALPIDAGAQMQPAGASRRQWIAFAILCLATLMNVLDTTVANIALKPIHDSLGFSNAGLAWVINAYMLTLGGFLLLAGRVGD